MARGAPVVAPLAPRIVHQQWKTDAVPAAFLPYRRAFLRLFPEPEYRHILWTDASMRAFVAERHPWFLDTYDGYDSAIKRADAFRVFVLYEMGGLYADLDYEPLVNFWDRLPGDRPALVESPSVFYEVAQNSLMSSPPGHPFWLLAMDVLVARAATHPHPVDATGPVALGAAMALEPGAAALLPCENFFRVPLGEAGRHTHATERVMRRVYHAMGRYKACGDVGDPACQFGIHHNAMTWS